jgi:hypothetical protein
LLAADVTVVPVIVVAAIAQHPPGCGRQRRLQQNPLRERDLPPLPSLSFGDRPAADVAVRP